jgi:hypothetical protein
LSNGFSPFRRCFSAGRRCGAAAEVRRSRGGAAQPRRCGAAAEVRSSHFARAVRVLCVIALFAPAFRCCPGGRKVVWFGFYGYIIGLYISISNLMPSSIIKEANLMKQSITQTIPHELEEKIKALAKPGMVFSDPVQAGDFTLITACRYRISRRAVLARPVGVIFIGPKGVKIHNFRNNLLFAWLITMVAAIVFWSAMILHPPWRENVSLLPQVRKLIRTIRAEKK